MSNVVMPLTQATLTADGDTGQAAFETTLANLLTERRQSFLGAYVLTVGATTKTLAELMAAHADAPTVPAGVRTVTLSPVSDIHYRLGTGALVTDCTLHGGQSYVIPILATTTISFIASGDVQMDAHFDGVA